MSNIIDPMQGIRNPSHYTAGEVETIDKVKIVTAGLDPFVAFCLGNIIKYVDRAGLKEGQGAEKDLLKANNYAHYLTTGKWRE